MRVHRRIAGKTDKRAHGFFYSFLGGVTWLSLFPPALAASHVRIGNQLSKGGFEALFRFFSNAHLAPREGHPSYPYELERERYGAKISIASLRVYRTLV
jgi:hypothetical protein